MGREINIRLVRNANICEANVQHEIKIANKMFVVKYLTLNHTCDSQKFDRISDFKARHACQCDLIQSRFRFIFDLFLFVLRIELI